MRLITITGPSGAGKDTVARMISEQTGWPVVCSYTTRPMREGEQEGREHHFVKTCNVPHSDMLAYTKYGGYEYWTTKEQIKDTAIYVIDEDGLRTLRPYYPDIEMVHLYVDVPEDVRRARGISEERIARDKRRHLLPEEFYHYFIHNNGSKERLRAKVSFFLDWLIIAYHHFFQ